MPDAIEHGLDYSARELTPQEIDDYNRANPGQPITYLIRYIGYSANRKCISHYAGALKAHEASGRKVLLVHQIAYQDFARGYEAGVEHAQIAVADAERQGWEWNRPIFAAFDRWLASHDPNKGIYPISLDTVRGYVAGFRSVLGDWAGLYGFYDVMGPAVQEEWVRWFWQCGAESALVPGVQFYQWNNGRVHVNGLECDLNKSYIDLSALEGDDMASFSDQEKADLLEGARSNLEGAEGKRHAGAMYALAAKVETKLGEIDDRLTGLTTTVEELLRRPQADVDEAALAAELEARGFDGVSAAELKAILHGAFARAANEGTN